jgi:hypothetical protein
MNGAGWIAGRRYRRIVSISPFCADEDVGSFQLLATIQAQVQSEERWQLKEEEEEEGKK